MRPLLLIIFLISVSLNLYAGNSYQSDSSIFYFEKGVKAKSENKNILAITYFKKAFWKNWEMLLWKARSIIQR
jgi:hypothetical protein